MTPRTSSSVSEVRVSSSERESSGEITLKKGFSVVAATSVTQRFSTPGSRASCWALVKRCTSSTNSTVSSPDVASRWRAASMAARTSLTPAVTAETSTKARWVCLLRMLAMVVLPVPGGPHSSRDIGWSPSTRRRSGDPGASSCSWPARSSRVSGRIRTANGAEPCWLPASVPAPGPRPGTWDAVGVPPPGTPGVTAVASKRPSTGRSVTPAVSGPRSRRVRRPVHGRRASTRRSTGRPAARCRQHRKIAGDRPTGLPGSSRPVHEGGNDSFTTRSPFGNTG